MIWAVNQFGKYLVYQMSFKPGLHQPQAGPTLVFLKLLLFMHQYVYLCLSPMALIASGMIWCDIDPV